MALFYHLDDETRNAGIILLDAAVVLAAFVGEPHAPVKTDSLISDL